MRKIFAAVSTAALGLGLVGLASLPSAAIPASEPVTDAAEFEAALTGHTCGSALLIEIQNDISDFDTSDPQWDCDDDLYIFSTDGDHFTMTGVGTYSRFLNADDSSGTVTITDLTITNFGRDLGGTAYRYWTGGAITAGGPVVIEGSTFSNNRLVGSGTGSSAQGGAIYSSSSVTVQPSSYSTSLFTGNYTDMTTGNGAWAAGGAIYATGSFQAISSDFEDNYATSAGPNGSSEGGAVDVNGTATVSYSTFSDNWAEAPTYAYGGALRANSTVTVESSTFSGNSADGYSGVGGAVATYGEFDAIETDFDDNSSSSTDTTGGGGALYAVSVNMEGMSFTGNTTTATDGADALGGAVKANASSYVGYSEFVDNLAESTGDGDASGGAIWVDGELDVTHSTFDGNSATATEDDTTAWGGAVLTYNTATFEFSTFVENAVLHTSASGDAFGGAVATGDENSARFYASTLTGNQAQAATPGNEYGGAAYSFDMWGISSTFTENDAHIGAALYFYDLDGFGSVYADNTGGNNCDYEDVSYSENYNFDDDGTCFPTSGTDFGDGADPMLGSLQDNGGFTKTQKPEPGSPLIDAIPDAECVAGGLADTGGFTEFTDQRGFDRPSTNCDIGAVEVAGVVTFTVTTPAGDINATVYDAEDSDFEVYVDPSTLGTPPADVSFPFGAISYTLEVPENGWTVTVVLELPSPVNGLWKYTAGAWSKLPGVTIDGTTLTFELQDGGLGDDDETADGYITDPAAPGIGASFTG